MMDHRHLRYFLALAQTLHFGKAAAQLHMTQPPLSISIRNLEAMLGGKLFIRDNRKTELTELGRALVGPARRAVQALDDVGNISQAMAMGEVGTLTVSYPNSAAHRLLPSVLPEFTRTYPNVDLRLIEATSADTLAMLEQQSVDIGIIYHPIHCSHAYIPLPNETDVLVAIFPLGHPLARKRSVRLAELAEHPFVAFAQTRIPTLPVIVSMACQRAGFVPRIVHYAQRVETVISLVRSGVGISLVPRVCAQTYSHVIAMRPVQDQGDALQIGMGVVLAPHARNRRVTNFLRIAGIDVTQP